MRAYLSLVLLAFMSLSFVTPAQAHCSMPNCPSKDGKASTEMMKSSHMAAFTKEDKELIHKTMKAVHDKDEAMMPKFDDLHAQLKKIVSTEPFDDKAYGDITSKMSQMHEEMNASRSEAMTSLLKQFDSKKRVALMDMFMHHGHEDWGHHAKEAKDMHSHHHSMMPVTPTAAKPASQPMPSDSTLITTPFGSVSTTDEYPNQVHR